ncbi:uncharacterized protein [Medicago truncatula]|uniref:uncharacterized protein isoform X2 n=1 Tax=Medicago truncatula TaxID=3880 RepID=UPI000D2F408F|nr:uncharacterized protein LOC112421391 isoform X2 [Medicago truncatula]
MGDQAGPSQSELSTQSNRKRGRGCTRMKKLKVKTAQGQKLQIEFQPSGIPSGENAKKFKYQDNWDIPNENIVKVKKKTMIYARGRWRAFKNSLTSRYLFKGDLSHKSPTEAYDFIDGRTWKEFVKTRDDPSFLEKRKNAQKAQANNKHPHLLSKGGYALLVKKMMQEKLKNRQEAAGDSDIPPPSPPQRHEKWKRARLKPSGEYTSEETRLVAKKIDSLVSNGFEQQGRKDILTEALGQPEHPGRVRAVGQGVGIREHFGSQFHSTQTVINDAQLAALKVDLTKQVKEQAPQSIYSHQNQNFPICSPNTAQHVSTNGSCSNVQSMPEEDIPKECELYIDGSIVAYANMYNLGPTIHNQVPTNDMVRVSITKVIDAKAQVPEPTDEVTTVAEAVNTFIKWQKRLLQVIANKDSLVSNGFEQQGRKDILTEALGQPEHPGRVCAVGQGVEIREHFGSQSHSTQSVINDAQLAALKVDLTKQIFADSTPFHKDEVKNFQECCQNMIMKFTEAKADSSPFKVDFDPRKLLDDMDEWSFFQIDRIHRYSTNSNSLKTKRMNL